MFYDIFILHLVLLSIISMAKQGKERIIAASFQLFLERGYKGVGIKDIIAETGLSKGAIYHHFKSKYEIYLASLDLYFFKILNNDFANDTHSDLKQQLRSRFLFFTNIIDFVENQGDGIAFPIRTYFIFQLESEQDDEILQKVKVNMDAYRLDIIELVQKAKDRGEVSTDIPAAIIAQQLMSMMEGIAIHHSAVKHGCKEFLLEKYDEVIEPYLQLLMTRIPEEA